MRSVGHQTKDKLVCGELDTLVGKELDKVIYKVVKDGNVSGTRELLDTYDGVTERDIYYDGSKALHVATLNGHVDVAKLLIQKGADVNAVDKYYRTSLHRAALKAYVDIAKLLIQNGADVNAMGNANRTSLHAAAGNGHIDVAKLLIQNGADMDVVDIWKQSALFYASCRSKSAPVILELLCRGAKIDKKALVNDETGLLDQIKERLEKLRNGEYRITNLCSNEENKFKWSLAFCLTLKAKVPAFQVYYKVRSFITFNGIFMAHGYDLGKGSIWRK